MATEKEYYDRANLLENAWQEFKPVGAGCSYITDSCVDLENASYCKYGTPEFWDAMLMSLDCSVAIRLEDMGIAWSSFPVALNY